MNNPQPDVYGEEPDARLCAHCAAIMPPPRSTGPLATYCSSSCRRKAYEARHPQRILQQRRKKNEISRQRTAFIRSSIPTISCPICGTRFKPATVGKSGVYRKYCSRTCTLRGFYELRKEDGRQGRIFTEKRERRALARQPGMSDVARPKWRQRVFDRDGWTCYLCHDLVDQDARSPEPWSPVVDHVVPLARGGAHSSGNWRCAHFICNSVKKDLDVDEARPIVLAYLAGHTLRR